MLNTRNPFFSGLTLLAMMFAIDASSDTSGRQEAELEETVGKRPAADDMFITPFGPMKKELVHQHPAGSLIRNNADGLTSVLYLDGTQNEIPASSDFQSGLTKQSGLPIEYKWFNYASFYSEHSVDGPEVGVLYGKIIVPDNPPAGASGQVLYYFTGVVDYSDEIPSILQPVLGFGPRANGSGVDGWSLASWNCCPSGQAHMGNTLVGMQPGDVIETEIHQSTSSDGTPSYVINAYWKDQRTTLEANTFGFLFNWSTVALKVYDVDYCSQFPSSPITFYDLSVKDTKGNPLDMYWQITGNGAACNTELKLKRNGSITIEQDVNESGSNLLKF